MSKHIPLTQEMLSSMPMGQVFELVRDIQVSCKETMEDLKTINEFISKNTLLDNEII